MGGSRFSFLFRWPKTTATAADRKLLLCRDIRIFIHPLKDYASNLNSAKAKRRVIFHVSQRLKQYFTGSASQIKVFPSFSFGPTYRNRPYLTVMGIYASHFVVVKTLYFFSFVIHCLADPGTVLCIPFSLKLDVHRAFITKVALKI